MPKNRTTLAQRVMENYNWASAFALYETYMKRLHYGLFYGPTITIPKTGSASSTCKFHPVLRDTIPLTDVCLLQGEVQRDGEVNNLKPLKVEQLAVAFWAILGVGLILSLIVFVLETSLESAFK